MAFFGLIGNDRKMAATNYSGRESATAKAARKADEKSARNRRGHRGGGDTRAARQGQRWDAEQRRQQGGY